MKSSVTTLFWVKVKVCRHLTSIIGTLLDAHVKGGQNYLQEATEELSKAHVALMKAETQLDHSLTNNREQ